MLKRLVTFGAMLALLVSLLVPTTAVLANEENTDNNEAVNEEVENSNENDAEANEENAVDETDTPAEKQETNLIYWIVIGYVFVLSVGLYAFTEGRRKNE